MNSLKIQSALSKKVIGFLFIFIAIIFSSCIPDPLEVNGIPVVKPQIVVSTQIVQDESLIVLLTKTFGALQGSDDSDPEELFDQIAVDDAVVIIEGPGGTDSLFMIRPGVYGGIQIAFQPDETYHLYVKSETLGEVTASTTVKPEIQFEDIKAELYYNGYDDTLAQVTYAIQDPPGRNWYMFNVQEVEQEDFIENILNPRAFTRLLDDAPFDGENYQETFRVFPRDYKAGDTIAVSISNVSKEYYDFIKLRQDNRFSFVQYLSEPVNYPTNVVGGKGFFNLYIPDIRPFVLE
jgi:hypothetical protein